MPEAISVKGTYLFGRETSYATGGTADKDIGAVQSFTWAPEQNAEEDFAQGSAKAIYVKGGLLDVKGNIRINMQHGRPLEWAWYGGTTTHAATSGDTVHTMVWADSLPSLKVEYGYEMGTTDIDTVMTGMIFNNTTVSLDRRGKLELAGDFVAKTSDISATTVPAAVVDTGASLGGFEGSVSMGGSSVSFVRSWSVGFNRNTKNDHGQGGRAPAYGASHLNNVTWSATIGLENTTQLQRLLGGTTISADEPTSFTNIFAADNGIALGSGKRALSLTLTGCQVKTCSLAAEINDFVVYTLTGSGIPSTCTFTDQVTSVNW